MEPWTDTRYLLHITTASDKPYPAQMTVDEQTFERVVAEQIEPNSVSVYYYDVTFKPSVIIPDVRM